MKIVQFLVKGGFLVLLLLVAIGAGRTNANTGKPFPPDMSYLNGVNRFFLSTFIKTQSQDVPELQINIDTPQVEQSPETAPKPPVTRETAGRRANGCKDIRDDSTTVTSVQIGEIEARMMQASTGGTPLMREEVYRRLGNSYCTLDLFETNGNTTEAWMTDNSIQASDRVRLELKFNGAGKVIDYKLAAI